MPVDKSIEVKMQQNMACKIKYSIHYAPFAALFSDIH